VRAACSKRNCAVMTVLGRELAIAEKPLVQSIILYDFPRSVSPPFKKKEEARAGWAPQEEAINAGVWEPRSNFSPARSGPVSALQVWDKSHKHAQVLLRLVAPALSGTWPI